MADSSALLSIIREIAREVTDWLASLVAVPGEAAPAVSPPVTPSVPAAPQRVLARIFRCGSNVPPSAPSSSLPPINSPFPSQPPLLDSAAPLAPPPPTGGVELSSVEGDIFYEA